MVRVRVRNTDPIPIDEGSEMAYQGKQEFGPMWEQVFGYWG